MPPQLRIVVTGDTNSGKSTLNNAITGRDLLPTAFQSETSVIAYVVPQHTDVEAAPVLRAYGRGDQGLSELAAAVEGGDAVRDSLRQLNHTARRRPDGDCIECRVDCPLRSSLNVFVPPGAEWEHVQLLDIGGPDDVLNPKVQACADLAYALSHRILVCVRFDQTTSRATRRLIEEIRAKAPYHFDDELASRERCPLIFVITQADQALEQDGATESLEVLRQNLRALLHMTLADCPEFAQQAPIVVVSAKKALQSLALFEELLILCAALKRDIVRDCKERRAAYIRTLCSSNLSLLPVEWPCNAASLWGARKDLAIKVAYGSAIAATSLGTAVALGVYLSAASAASAAAAQAASATAEASAASAAVNTWWAWLFGLGQYSAAASAATSAAAAAEASAASAAATASTWAIGSTVAGGLTGATISAAAAHNAVTQLTTTPQGVTHIAGMRVAHAMAVGARDARMVLRGLRFSATAQKIKAGEAYRDIRFYPESASPTGTTASALSSLSSLTSPFQLRSAENGRLLSFEGGQVQCVASWQDRASQLWWAVPTGQGEGTFVLQNVETLCNLLAEPGRLTLDPRLVLKCTAEVPGKQWRILPGGRDGTIRLESVEQKQCLFHNGWRVGCWSQQFPDQDWLIVPRAPLYIGDFVRDSMTGQGQFFWPNGAPLFKGEVLDGEFVKGFVFDERSVCHGYFSFPPDEESGAELEGPQPEDVDTEGRCLSCGEEGSIALMGRVLRPCGHDVLCEACTQKERECPYCRAPIEGTMRLT